LHAGGDLDGMEGAAEAGGALAAVDSIVEELK